MTRIANELHAMLTHRAFDVTRWVGRSAEVHAPDLTSHLRAVEKRGDIRQEFARRVERTVL